MKDLISIIVPAYNVGQYLSRCIDSILAQKYEPIEIIIVNDGSTDNTDKIIEKYVKIYPQKVKGVHIKNGGVTNARLNGIRLSKGKWIGFIDGDDVIENNMYERLLNNAVKYDAQISHCGYQMIFTDRRINYFYNTGHIVVQDNSNGIKDLLEGIFVEPGLCNKLFSRSLFDNFMNNNLMDKNIKINEDLLMNYYLFLKSKCSVYEDFCPYHYMVRDNSASRSMLNKNRIYDPIKVKEIIYQDSPTELKSVAKKVYISTCINVYNVLIINGGYKEEKKNVYKKIYKEKSNFYLLNRKTKLLAKLICQVPVLYPLMYRIYTQYFQKKKYD